MLLPHTALSNTGLSALISQSWRVVKADGMHAWHDAAAPVQRITRDLHD